MAEDSSRGDVDDITSLRVSVLPDYDDRSAPSSTNNSSHGIHSSNGIHGINARSGSSDSNSNSNPNSNGNSDGNGKADASLSVALPLALLAPPLVMVPPGRIIHIYKKNGTLYPVLSYHIILSCPSCIHSLCLFACAYISHLPLPYFSFSFSSVLSRKVYSQLLRSRTSTLR